MTFCPLKATMRLMWPPVKVSVTPLPQNLPRSFIKWSSQLSMQEKTVESITHQLPSSRSTIVPLIIPSSTPPVCLCTVLVVSHSGPMWWHQVSQHFPGVSTVCVELNIVIVPGKDVQEASEAVSKS